MAGNIGGNYTVQFHEKISFFVSGIKLILHFDSVHSVMPTSQASFSALETKSLTTTVLLFPLGLKTTTA